MDYHNGLVSMLKEVRESHDKLIRAVCDELGHPEKAGELVAKLLDSSFSSVKKKKDPNAPKRKKTGYMLFCDEKRTKIWEANSSAKMGDVSKILGKMWGDLSADEKAAYNTK